MLQLPGRTMAQDIDTRLKKNQISILMLTDLTVFLFSNIYFLFPVKPRIIIEVQIINIMELWNKKKKKKPKSPKRFSSLDQHVWK